ncbi:MAG: SPFH domain-containing protein [Actinomycetota bacterium]
MSPIEPSPPASPDPSVTTRTVSPLPGPAGIAMALFGIALVAGSIAGAVASESGWWAIGIVAGALVTTFALPGHYLVQPNQALVLMLFGRYRGTVDQPGWYWTNPFTKIESRTISTRVHNFTTPVSKVNDAEGNPIELAAVVVWRVVESARAVLDVDDFEDFVHVQSETAIRHLGMQYPYDDFQGDRISLRANPDEVAATLHAEVQERLVVAGVDVVETRLSHLAYATEIAEAMLRRQQAAAVVAARRTIVDGAVGMVEDALEMLNERSVVELDEERKATMVSNLLVVLTSEHQTTPVINTGSLY